MAFLPNICCLPVVWNMARGDPARICILLKLWLVVSSPYATMNTPVLWIMNDIIRHLLHTLGISNAHTTCIPVDHPRKKEAHCQYRPLFFTCCKRRTTIEGDIVHIDFIHICESKGMREDGRKNDCKKRRDSLEIIGCSIFILF